MGAGAELGRVAGLWRYPVKSMAGEALAQADVFWNGLTGDRRWAFIRPGMVRSDFPWLTIRERADLWHYRPRFVEPARPDDSPTVVRTPAGAELDVADRVLAGELGEGVTLIKQNRGCFDAMPLSLITLQSIASLAELTAAALEPERFRPNLLIDAAAGGFVEADWVGCLLRVGQLVMRVDERDQRCAIITTDPVSGHRDPAVLRTLAREQDACIGVYGSVVEPGSVAVGDSVTLVGPGP